MLELEANAAYEAKPRRMEDPPQNLLYLGSTAGLPKPERHIISGSALLELFRVGLGDRYPADWVPMGLGLPQPVVAIISGMAFP